MSNKIIEDYKKIKEKLGRNNIEENNIKFQDWIDFIKRIGEKSK